MPDFRIDCGGLLAFPLPEWYHLALLAKIWGKGFYSFDLWQQRIDRYPVFLRSYNRHCSSSEWAGAFNWLTCVLARVSGSHGKRGRDRFAGESGDGKQDRRVYMDTLRENRTWRWPTEFMRFRITLSGYIVSLFHRPFLRPAYSSSSVS
jgi:hypothetical protein